MHVHSHSQPLSRPAYAVVARGSRFGAGYRDVAHQFQFAGYYMALEKGFYRDAGLEVRLHPNGYQGSFVSPVDAVLSAEADYGISNSG